MTAVELPPAPPALDPAALLAKVTPWLNELARRHHRDARLTRGELFHHLQADVYAHAGLYDPARGSPTNWAAWRCRAVLFLLARGRERDRRRRVFGPEATFALEDAEGREPDPLEAAHLADLRAAVADALRWLPKRWAELLRLRYGLGGERPQTLDEIGRAFGVTRERVRVVEQEALEKLRPHLERAAAVA